VKAIYVNLLVDDVRPSNNFSASIGFARSAQLRLS
jgi:predicted lactoylglutathione lyase